MSGAAAERMPRHRGLLWAGVVMLAIVLLQAAAVAAAPNAPWTQGIDDAWRRMIGVGPDSGAYTWFLPMLFQELGQLPGLMLMFLVVPIVLVVLGRWRTALFALALQLAGPGLMSQGLKNIVNRPRPAADAAAGLYGPLFTVDHGSFPSGHNVSAAVLAVLLVALFAHTGRTARIVTIVVGALLIVGMIWQRTLVNAHWFTDCLSGMLVGLGVGLVLWWAFEPWLRADRGRRPAFIRA